MDKIIDIDQNDQFTFKKDYISVIGPRYFQPIADLIEKMLISSDCNTEVSHRENGYAVSIVILLVALLESFISRLYFCRKEEINPGINVPDLIITLFPDYPDQVKLQEVFIVRNSMIHNHIWHIEVAQSSDETEISTQTLQTPKDFKRNVKANFDILINRDTQKTIKLQLNACPTSVNRNDVLLVFEVVWNTLNFMNKKNFSHTPLAGGQISFRNKREKFSDLIEVIRKSRDQTQPN